MVDGGSLDNFDWKSRLIRDQILSMIESLIGKRTLEWMKKCFESIGIETRRSQCPGTNQQKEQRQPGAGALVLPNFRQKDYEFNFCRDSCILFHPKHQDLDPIYSMWCRLFRGSSNNKIIVIYIRNLRRLFRFGLIVSYLLKQFSFLVY